MANNRKTNRKNNTSTQKPRPTIGFLIETVSLGGNQYYTDLWTGVADAARGRDANLVCFTGGTLDRSSFIEFAEQRNVLYDLVASDNVDGLVISGGSLSSRVHAGEFQAFCERFRPLPMVSIAAELDGSPSVMVDNVTGLRDAVSHLIETHSYRRLACILGPKRNEDAMERYRAYVETLTEHGLVFNPALTVRGEFSRASGAVAMCLLLDERKLRPGIDFDAVVVLNDGMAMGALDVLRERGIQVPYDVAVVGFDDLEEARVSTPALTTVRQPIREQATRAVDMVLAQLKGKDMPGPVILRTQLVVRQSCGCHSQTVLQADAQSAVGVAAPGGSAGGTLEGALAARRDGLVDVMVQAVVASSANTASAAMVEWAGQVLDSFAAGMKDTMPSAFLLALDRVLRQQAEESNDTSAGPGQRVAAWQGALLALRGQVLPGLSDAATAAQAENMLQQGCLFVAEAALQAQRYHELQTERQVRQLQEIGQAVVSTFDVDELMDVMARELPGLDIPSSYISLYDGANEGPAQESRLILAYDVADAQHPKGRFELAAGGRRFPSRALAPNGMLPQERIYNMVVEPLYFQNRHLGFALFEAGPRNGAVYELLRGQLSSALQAALLSQQMKRQAFQFQTAAEVSNAASEILDPDRFIQQVVDLVQKRFELHHVGLFLVDTGETGDGPDGAPCQRWAVLRASAGGVGKRMLAAGYRLPVDGSSKVGRCIANRQTCTELDVTLVGHPGVKGVRSELALPLISRGEVIGALTIQSTRVAAFSEGDIAALQTIACQLANAVGNAQL